MQGKDFEGLIYLLNIRKFGSVQDYINSLSPKSKQNNTWSDLSRTVKQLELFLGVSLRTKSKPQELNDKGLLIADELQRLENLINFFKKDNLKKIIFYGSKSYTDIFVSPLAAELFTKYNIASIIKNGNSRDTLKAISDGAADLFLIKKSSFENLSSFMRKGFVTRPLKYFTYQWAIPKGFRLNDIIEGKKSAVGLSLEGDTMNFISKKYKNIKWCAFFPYFKDVADFAKKTQCAALVPSYFSELLEEFSFADVQGYGEEHIILVSPNHIYSSSVNVKHSFDYIFSKA